MAGNDLDIFFCYLMMIGREPLHEAVRIGDVDVCKFLIDSGASIDSCTANGGTPLWWARQFHPPDHEVVCYLRDIGAPDHHESDVLDRRY